MGMFSKVKTAKVTPGGAYFEAGLFRVQILKVKAVESQVGDDEFVAIETRVLESNNPKIVVGAERSQVINMGNVMGPPNFKQFLAAASGVEPESEDVNDQVEKFWKENITGGEYVELENICELVTSEAQPLEGIEMELECIDIITKKEKKNFTKHVWQTRSV